MATQPAPEPNDPIPSRLSSAQANEIPTSSDGLGFMEVFHDFPRREEILRQTNETFAQGIELFAGRACRKESEKKGLAKIHEYFPHERLGLLEAYVVEKMRERWLLWAAAVCQGTLGWKQEFYVQDLIVLRVSYPQAVEAIPAESPVSFYTRVRYGMAPALERLRSTYYSKKLPFRLKELAAFIEARRNAPPGRHRCRASHVDSWQGQPLHSLSVWLGVAGVNRDNALCLFPETQNYKMPQNGTLDFGEGFLLPQPRRPGNGDGDLLIFTTDMLHCTQLNVTDETRVALSIRVSPDTSTFDEDNFWSVQRCHSGKRLLAGDTSAPGRNGARTVPVERKASGWPLEVREIQIDRPHRPSERVEVMPAAELLEGERVAVRFANREVLIFRTGSGLSAMAGVCPHHGYRMADGPDEGGKLTCPGHALEFDIETGRSKLDCFRLKKFPVGEQDGKIFLGSD